MMLPQARTFGAEPVLNPDGTPLLDHNNQIIPVEKLLATKPLKGELSTRPGPGGRKLTYMSGDSVTRTLNDIFGFDGWSLEIKNTNREVCEDFRFFSQQRGEFHYVENRSSYHHFNLNRFPNFCAVLFFLF
jgi:hypothetical protein